MIHGSRLSYFVDKNIIKFKGMFRHETFSFTESLDQQKTDNPFLLQYLVSTMISSIRFLYLTFTFFLINYANW